MFLSAREDLEQCHMPRTLNIYIYQCLGVMERDRAPESFRTQSSPSADLARHAYASQLALERLISSS